jgi:hypothetical protein
MAHVGMSLLLCSSRLVHWRFLASCQEGSFEIPIHLVCICVTGLVQVDQLATLADTTQQQQQQLHFDKSQKFPLTRYLCLCCLDIQFLKICSIGNCDWELEHYPHNCLGACTLLLSFFFEVFQ